MLQSKLQLKSIKVIKSDNREGKDELVDSALYVNKMVTSKAVKIL